MLIEITEGFAIDESELEIKFVRSGGPGGQHVNKVATAVQLRFDATALEAEIGERLSDLAGNRMSSDGVITIEASRFRSQKRNREDAIERLVDLLRRAAEKPKTRQKTKPTARAKKRRLEDKRRRSEVKETRRSPIHNED